MQMHRTATVNSYSGTFQSVHIGGTSLGFTHWATDVFFLWHPVNTQGETDWTNLFFLWQPANTQAENRLNIYLFLFLPELNIFWVFQLTVEWQNVRQWLYYSALNLHYIQSNSVTVNKLRQPTSIFHTTASSPSPPPSSSSSLLLLPVLVLLLTAAAAAACADII